jgi:hypothetical protein
LSEPCQAARLAAALRSDGFQPHLAPALLRTHIRGSTGERRMRNLILALATLAGVVMVAVSATHTF